MSGVVQMRILLTIAVAVWPVPQLYGAEPTIRETRDGGWSVIEITPAASTTSTASTAPAAGNRSVYRIDLSHHHSPATQPTETIQRWQALKFGAFVCFNTNQFSGQELCTATDARLYSPTRLDVAGWIAAFKDVGMKYAILTTRHTSGFSLWDSAATELDVAASPNHTDVCAQFVNECRRQGLVPGFYYCLWGGAKWNPRSDARAVILAQLYELASKYGRIPYFWLDMKNWGPDDLSTQEIYDELKNLQPDCVVEFNQHVQDGSEIVYFPTDVIDGELTLPPPDNNPHRTIDGRQYYLPFDYSLVSQSRAGGYEHDPLGPSCWFTYAAGKDFADSRPFPAQAVAWQVEIGFKRGANVLLAAAPDCSGSMRRQDVEQLRVLGLILARKGPCLPQPVSKGSTARASSVREDKPEWAAANAADHDPQTCWAAGADAKQGWLELTLPGPRQFDTVLIAEEWGRIRRFQLQVEQDGGWRVLLEGQDIGPYCLRQLPSTSARRIRLNILEAGDYPVIREFELFDTSRPGGS